VDRDFVLRSARNRTYRSCVSPSLPANREGQGAVERATCCGADTRLHPFNESVEKPTDNTLQSRRLFPRKASSRLKGLMG
jgi:hypothetical protein